MNQELISVISAFFGSLGFSIIYNIRGLRIWIPAIGGAVFWAVYLIFLHFINNEFLGFFFVAILITIYSEIWARILKTPSTVILMPTVIPLIPGGSLYYAMDAALRHDMPQFFLKSPGCCRTCCGTCSRYHGRNLHAAFNIGAYKK